MSHVNFPLHLQQITCLPTEYTRKSAYNTLQHPFWQAYQRGSYTDAAHKISTVPKTDKEFVPLFGSSDDLYKPSLLKDV